MAAAFVGGAALGAAFGELFKAVLDVTNKTLKFNSILKKLETTLISIKPMFDEIQTLNRKLDRSKEETDMFINQLKQGIELVHKCSRIKCWNVVKHYTHSKKLLKLDNSLLRLFQIDVQVQMLKDNLETLVAVNDMEDRLDEIRFNQTNGIGSSGFSGLCGVPELRGPTVGLDAPVEDLKAMLLRDGASVVVLSAPGGSGKTTLAKKLCHDDEIKGIFRNIFFVTVSKMGNLKVIVQKLFQHKGSHQLPGFRSDEDATNQLEHLMRKIGPDPILLVLDDVWSEWESLVEKFMFKIPGYKILVTSRIVFSRFDSIYILKRLNDQDAMTLFRYSAFPQHGSSFIPKDLVNKIVKGCKGSPLALTVVGGSLNGKPAVYWRILLQKWSEGQSIFDSNSDVLLPLQTSLDALDEMSIIKECYLDLGSFPEDQKIPANALMDMWVELYDLDEDGIYYNLLQLSFRNLVNLVPSRKDAIDVDGCCNELFVMQHDLLRELAIYRSSQEPIEQRKRLIMDISGNDIPKRWIEQMHQPIRARLLSISIDETFPTSWYDMQLPEVEVLILNIRTRNYTLPHFIERMDQLKVLIVTNYGFCPAELNNYPVLGYLSSLRRIRLEHVSISSFNTSLLQMRNLQKISLTMCEIGKAFENCTIEIPNLLPNLLEIDIDYCDDLVEFPDGLCNIVHLKKLSITYCNEMGALPDGFGRLTNLEVLRLHSCTKLVELPESIGNLHKLCVLDISYCLCISKFPEQMGELHSLRTLDMRGCSGICELPPLVEDLWQLEQVICDEETAILWEPFKCHLTNLDINVVKEDINLNWLHNLRP